MDKGKKTVNHRRPLRFPQSSCGGDDRLTDSRPVQWRLAHSDETQRRNQNPHGLSSLKNVAKSKQKAGAGATRNLAGWLGTSVLYRPGVTKSGAGSPQM